MLQKTVNICGKDVNFRSSASVPRLYRAKFGRDIFKDLSKLEKAYRDKGSEEASAMEIEDLEIFENVAYIMAFHADPSFSLPSVCFISLHSSYHYLIYLLANCPSPSTM